MTHSQRRVRLAARLAADGLDALLVSDLVNVRYLSGFTGSNAALIVFAGDNGCEVGCDQGPLRGKKGTPYEGGTRVPLIVSWPGHVQAGATYGQAVSLMDIYPTLLDAAGRPARATQGLDGVSLLPALRGSPVLPHAELFFSTRPGQASVKSGGWKLYQFRGRYELYDLRADLGELLGRGAELGHVAARGERGPGVGAGRGFGRVGEKQDLGGWGLVSYPLSSLSFP